MALSKCNKCGLFEETDRDKKGELYKHCNACRTRRKQYNRKSRAKKRKQSSRSSGVIDVSDGSRNEGVDVDNRREGAVTSGRFCSRCSYAISGSSGCRTCDRCRASKNNVRKRARLMEGGMTEEKASHVVHVVERKEVDSSKALNIGKMDRECPNCKALLFNSEVRGKAGFNMCCRNGDVEIEWLPEPEGIVRDLLTCNTANWQDFHQNIRFYNSSLAFVSFGGDDRSFHGQCAPNVRIAGEIYHLFGSLVVGDGQMPRFAQRYVYDEVEISENGTVTLFC